MPAVMYTNLNSVCDNLRFQVGDIVGLEVVTAAIAALQVANPSWLVEELDTDEKNNMLRKLTGCTVATGTDLNCYPRGLDSALCFDLDGHEVP
jgi:hypothetical protein